MKRRFVQLVAVLMCVIAIGAHWALLQSVAWAGMFLGYSQKAPVTVALVRTFDGQQPCALCKTVKAGREAERQQQTTQIVVKLDALVSPSVPSLEAPPSSSREMVFPFDAFLISRADPPPTPPPDFC